MTSLVDPKLVMLANSAACHCEAFGHTSQDQDMNQTIEVARTIVAWLAYHTTNYMTNLNFIIDW